MKSIKLKSVVLVMVMMMSQLAVFANTDNPNAEKGQISVKAMEGTKIVLTFPNWGKGITSTVQLKNTDYQDIYTTEISEASGYSMKINLSKLENSEYWLVITRGKEVYRQLLSINRIGFVTVGEMVETTKPTLVQKMDSFIIKTPSANVKNVSIFDTNGALVYTKKYKSKERQAKEITFNLKEIKNGKYTVRITTSDDVFYKPLEVKNQKMVANR